ncbi:membrane protein insertase YidC [Syntrophus aciditrophicus]|uniref:Membrane protein insertase YidC n=1 Tax=Syntrophus aciditrophicus (strain SB) TaxID=56780 RepID=YIDC_SYNAS|nr:membrane protein insertase YidC [Syntrophus aciditrophicus]Q2LSF9.1 RecName: Full=Membrane protein insertase YidC; AltName: Full=Foldase YidC; AltName: Full=Membrane integrase YidC; AltName: Full=Membrane protein YidC [Syntrophus aciditrophicus SB]ABC77019.1 60 kDa inner membrane protein [Syntrophus aciditrophicus SB]OPY18159.1 MAG: Membrane protein insertase YidC [Syntrophus sp. PtaB.Bin075]
MDKKALLALVLSAAVLLIYQIFIYKTTPPPKPVNENKSNTVVVNPAAPVSPQTPADEPSSGSAANPETAAALPVDGTEKEQEITVDTPLYQAVFTTKGGALKSFALKNYRETLAVNSKPIELVDVKEAMPYPLGISFPASSVDVSPASFFKADVPAIDLKSTSESRRLTFVQTWPGKIKIEKIYTFNPGKYAIDLEIRTYNLSEVPLSQEIALFWNQYVDPSAKEDSYGHTGPVSYVAKDVEREKVTKMETPKSLGPDVSWGGFESKYFIAAMIPQNPSLTSLSLSKDSSNMVSTSLKGPKNIIPPGQAGFFTYKLFLGPKDYNILKAQGVGLENAIDFGSWLKWLAMPLLLSLKFLYNYVHNYGIAIIILTILIKILFWPLGNKSYKSMKEMQKLQPKMLELREKYKNDKARLSQETMALYKAYKVNPMGGCLPMIIQIPVFFGLYKALLYAIELRHSPFFLWIQDLSAKDPYYITPIIMGATMFLQQKMTPVSGDPTQAKIMLWMPVIFTFMFLNFPSGLVIYWLFNNILSIGQQYYINKQA